MFCRSKLLLLNVIVPYLDDTACLSMCTCYILDAVASRIEGTIHRRIPEARALPSPTLMTAPEPPGRCALRTIAATPPPRMQTMGRTCKLCRITRTRAGQTMRQNAGLSAPGAGVAGLAWPAVPASRLWVWARRGREIREGPDETRGRRM